MTKSHLEDPDLYDYEDCRPPRGQTSIQYDPPPWLRAPEAIKSEPDEASTAEGNQPDSLKSD